MERVVPCAIRLCYRRTSARGAAFIGRSLQPGRCAVGRRLYQHTSALRGSREDRLPGAQLVNVIAPLMTNTTGLVRQTILYPYSWALQYGRGSVLDVLMEN